MPDLRELTTLTSWQGYSTAKSNGQLVASKVTRFFATAAAAVIICNPRRRITSPMRGIRGQAEPPSRPTAAATVLKTTRSGAEVIISAEISHTGRIEIGCGAAAVITTGPKAARLGAAILGLQKTVMHKPAILDGIMEAPAAMEPSMVRRIQATTRTDGGQMMRAVILSNTLFAS